MARRTSVRAVFGTCLTVLTATVMARQPQTGAGAQAQSARPKTVGTASMTGRVVDAVSGAALPGAIVRITIQPVVPATQAGVTGAVGSAPQASAVAAVAATVGARGGGSFFVSADSSTVLVAGPNGGVVSMDMSGSDNPPLRILTDANGQFAFRYLPAGSVSFSVQASGYSGGGYGQLRPDARAQSLDLADGQHVGDIDLKMWHNGAITGMVTDETGEPVVGVFVRVLRRVVAAGQPVLELSGAGQPTDDRGIYRAYDLLPGDYVVVVPSTRVTTAAPAPGEGGTTIVGPAGAIRIGQPASGQQIDNLLVSGGTRGAMSGPSVVSSGGRLSVYPTTYYPSATVSSRATIVTVKAGEERTAVDLQLPLVAASRVSGMVLDVESRPVANLAVLLLSLDADQSVDGVPDSVATTVTDATGAFTMLGVPPGQYMLSVSTLGPAGGQRVVIVNGVNVSPPTPRSSGWARVPVTVNDADVTGLAVSLRPGLHLSGRVVFQGTSPPPQQLQRALLRVASVGHGAQAGRGGGSAIIVSPADGAFAVSDLPPGQYMLLPVGALPTWSPKSIVVDGHDMSDMPIDLTGGDVQNVIVTFTDRPGQIGGAVRTPSGAADPDALVVGFPADPREWGWPNALHLFNARATTTGTYSATKVCPGDYDVVAISDMLDQNWRDPQVLARFAAMAVRVHVNDNDHLRQDLTTSTVR